MDWNLVAAVASVITALATVLLAWVAWYQLGAIAQNQREWESLKACERYDTDPIIDRALCLLRDARNSGALFTEPVTVFSLEYSTVLNYFEALATGIEQGFYVEEIIRDHLQGIMKFHVSEAFTSLKLPRDLGDYEKVEHLLAAWAKDRTYFKRRR